uniref:RBR-type E3 ubiquitin transferase n=1 Tax=Romanomermis culicivorax TaxID=13658 RepID=A0A915HUK9_ROMCU
MFSRKKAAKKTSNPSVVTPSLLVPLTSISAQKSPNIVTKPPQTEPRTQTNISNDELTAKIESKKRRRSLLGGSRLSVYSLFYPSAYSNRRLSRPIGSRSVNDIHNAVVVEQHQNNNGEHNENDVTSSSERENLMSSSSSSTANNNLNSVKSKFQECPLCCIRQPMDNFPTLLSCNHRSCRSCLVQIYYLQIDILESRVLIACPECNELMHPNDIQRLLLNHRQVLDKYEEFSVRRVLMIDPDTRWCPSPDCNFAVIASGCAACPELKCERPGCNTLFCYHCKMIWHPSQTCTEARAQRGSLAQSTVQVDTTVKPGDVKPCPRCRAYITKADDGSCNHMVCSMCGAEFCWLCMKEISDLHYLSPSGCTFWAKKPWSRKKKLIWQFGMLIGAPIGIALVAGFAVPAIMFGVPVWIGRKVHTKLKNSSKTKRRAAVTLSVAGSILMGPALATMAVGVGVPIMLAYVYGVVPLSLCRNGSCGVTASPSGVRLDLDSDLFEPNEALDSVSHEKTQLLTNGDRSDVITMISGRSGTASINQHKIQVHAEMAYVAKRRPSIESGAISLGDRQNYEDASVQALGGSVYYDDKNKHKQSFFVRSPQLTDSGRNLSTWNKVDFELNAEPYINPLLVTTGPENVI